MQVYNCLGLKGVAELDRLLACVPAKGDVPERLFKDLDRVEQALTVQYGQIDSVYGTQTLEIEEEHADAH